MEAGNRKVYINLLYYPVTTLGMGARFGIWFQGCGRKCSGCISEHTWYKENGIIMTINEIINVILMNKEKITGVTISGGEPFEQSEALRDIVDELFLLGIKDILIYTGFRYGDIKKKYSNILSKTAVLIDGEYIDGLETESIWKGSENQKMVLLTNDKDLRTKYVYYSKIKGKQLQIIEENGRILVIGIPKQSDGEKIIEELNKNL